jgi:hypothetical protein
MAEGHIRLSRQILEKMSYSRTWRVKGWYSVRIQTETICSHHLTVNHEYNDISMRIWKVTAQTQSRWWWCTWANTTACQRQTQKADDDTAYASSDWPSVMKQTFLCNFLKYHDSFFSTVIYSLNTIINSHSSISYLRSSCILQWDSHCFSEHNWSQQPELSISFHKHCLHHDIKFTWLLCYYWTQFSKIRKEEEQKSEFSNYHKWKVNFSYWLSFLLLSWDLYMFISTSSSSSSSEIFDLSSTIKTRLYHSSFRTTRTKSLCWDHHRESLDCRPVRSFVSTHSHQQHHSHQKHWCVIISSHSRTAARCLSSERTELWHWWH